MKHTKMISRRPVQAQTAYASKLQFKQELSTTLTTGFIDGISITAALGVGYFINSLGLGAIIDFITDGGDGGGGGEET